MQVNAVFWTHNRKKINKNVKLEVYMKDMKETTKVS